jgi:hypothetical protein
VAGNAFSGGPVTSAWLTFQFVASLGLGSSNKLCGLGKYSTTNKGIFVGTSSSNGQKVALLKFDGSTVTQLATETGTSISLGSFHKFDMHVTNYGASSSIDVYMDGNLLISYTGDCSVSGVTGLDCVMCQYTRGSATLGGLSEFIVSTTDTRKMSLVTHYPNAAGDVLEFTGAYTTVDEITIDDSDLAYDNVDGHRAMYNLSNTPAGTFSVLAVKEAVRASRSSDSSPTSINLGIKSGGTVDVNANRSLGIGWGTVERLMTVNPVTGNLFTTAELDALQIVVESEA